MSRPSNGSNHRRLLSDPSPYEDSRWERTEKELAALEGAKTILVTCAQNNTAPDAGFLGALRTYCKERRAKLVVIPTRYRNPTSRSDPQEEEAAERATGHYWWHPEVRPYLTEQEVQPHDRLAIMGQVRIQATSPWPLREALWPRSHERSAIYGHPQLSMVSAPGRNGQKLLYTTGAVTRRNYSHTLAGSLADFHHTLGAVVAEVRGKRVHLREVTWDGEAFIDLDRRYTADGSEPAGRALALVTGDTHARFVDPSVVEATYTGEDSICARLKPEVLVWHDVFDGFSVSPFMDRLREAAMTGMGYASVQDELDHLCEFISRMTPQDARSVVVRSNHHTWLDRWIRRSTSIHPANLKLWHELSLGLLEGARDGPAGPEFPDPLALYCERRMERTRFLGEDEGFEVAGIELGMHGHQGPDGRRGARGLASLGYRSVVGHSHSPRLQHGVAQVGTSSRLRLHYNEGPSSWSHTHCVVLANGKRQLLHISDGAWHG